MVGLLSHITPTMVGGALQGKAGGTSILGAFDGDGASALFGDLGSTNSALMARIKDNASKRLNQAKAAINAQASDRRKMVEVQNERWISVKAQINLAQISVKNGQDSIVKVANTLLTMRGSVTNAGDPKEDAKLWRETFDKQVNAINLEASSGSPAYNLVGNINRNDFTPNHVEYRNSIALTSTRLTGTYIGHDYRIEADDGTTWIPDLSTDLIQSYDRVNRAPEKYTTNDGQTLAKATSTRNGLELVSYDRNSGRITVKISVVPDDPPIVVSGKLKTSGIGIMQSWFYNKFATEADRKRAYADINRAEVELTSARAALERSAATTSMDQRRADRALDDLSKQSVKIRTDQAAGLQDIQIKAAQQYIAMQNNLQNLSNQQANYLNAFGSFASDPFSQALLNITS